MFKVSMFPSLSVVVAKKMSEDEYLRAIEDSLVELASFPSCCAIDVVTELDGPLGKIPLAAMLGGYPADWEGPGLYLATLNQRQVREGKGKMLEEHGFTLMTRPFRNPKHAPDSAIFLYGAYRCAKSDGYPTRVPASKVKAILKQGEKTWAAYQSSLMKSKSVKPSSSSGKSQTQKRPSRLRVSMVW